MLALIAAMDEELSDLRNAMTVTGVDERLGFVVYCCTHSGKRVLLVRSGVGRQRADHATRCLLDHYPVTAIVSFGFAGALNASLKVGDVVACLSMVCSDRSHVLGCFSDSALVSAARACNESGLSCGVGVTAPRLVASKAAKTALLENSQADIVDMESYWIGVVAEENRVPFLAVRSVSDSATDSLPDLPSWKWRHVLSHFALHPASAFSLYRGVNTARKRMSRFMMQMVEVAA